ncbi:uncharacterized protein haspin [Cottoperca gobio]|uniref:Serine/threonine-protein kinase haspin n=1 Tax=Cottoperca gobio TaxID=56716 RepID=A0A6J2PIS2_COTGO|nr:serine/threonine-protein kinase haspin [Cottoperca gobio]
MKPGKPLFLKTYGKERRMLPAWIVPENRKQTFDSTRSTDGDSSVVEPEKLSRIREKKTSVCRKKLRPAKKKAMLCLAEKSFDEENTSYSSCPQPAQQRKTTRAKKTSVVSGRAVRSAKRRAMLCLADTSSDEENISRTSSPSPQPAQQSKATSGHGPSLGRFVTSRRRAAKPKLPKKTFSNILGSSADFTSGAFSCSKILRPSRRRLPPSFVLSSAENSVNVEGTAGFATNPFREISLNESTEPILRACPRKPIFCSTPSAGSVSKRPRLLSLPVNDQTSTRPSMSVSCIGVLSTFQEDVNSPVQPVSPPCSASSIGLRSEKKPQSSLGEQEPDLHHHEEPSCYLFMESKSTNERSSCREDAKSHSEHLKTKNVAELPSLNRLSTDDSESSNQFVSAAGGLEWLIDALKEKCLREQCTVRLERFDNLTVSQLCSQTTYSSCLGLSSSAHSLQTNEHPPSVDSCQIVDLSQSLEPSNIRTSDSEHAASVTDSQSANNSPSAEYSSTQESMEQLASVLYGESTPDKDSSVEFIMSTQLPTNSSKGHTKKSTIQLKNSDANKSGNDDTHNIEDPEEFACSGEITQRMMTSVRRSIINSSPVFHERETKEKAALTTFLKEKCLTDKVNVEIKRLSSSQLRESLQLKDAQLKSPTDVSDSVRDDHQSERDTNHHNKETSAIHFDMKKRATMGLTRSEDKIASDKGEVKNSCNVLQKGKKISLVPKEKKRRSMSTDRPGTTRKACVSGLSVSRWKNKGSASTHVVRGSTAQTGGNKAVDCSLNELISTQHKRPREPLGNNRNFSTPVRASRLNLSSLLADLTPNTHTWSRLKAALSVHRKGMVQFTPSSLRRSVSGSHARAALADVSQDLFATPFRTPRHKLLQPQLLSRDSLVVCDDADLSDAEKVYEECGQPRPLPWEECILPRCMKQCVKIGEGTFGEVFSTTNASGDTVALKIIPVEGSEKVNGEDQKTLGEILHEIIISKDLSSLKEKQQNKTHGFIGLNDLHCVQGCYPPDFLNAWDTFDQQKGSENDRPDFFEKDQLFLILEFEFGGIDLENSNGTLASLVVAKSILHQVTAALAVAEQELHFEHRDLHWGNVLVKTTKEKKGSFLLNGAAHSLETKGVLVRIIDYSLSRLEIDGLTVSCDISNDEELFMGQGDYQFDIYRLMRQENGNNWSNYHPHSNVLWLHYLCSKLLSMKYRSSGGRGAKGIREELTCFYDNVLQYSSATEALQNCSMFQ